MSDFTGSLKVKAYFSNKKMYFAIKGNSLVAPYSLRQKIKNKGMATKKQLYPWSCSCAYAKAVLAENASLQKAAGEVVYQNPVPETFVMVRGCDKVFPGLTKGCVKEFIRKGTAIELMLTSCESNPLVNTYGEIVPFLPIAAITAGDRICVEGRFEKFHVQTVLTKAHELAQAAKSLDEKARIKHFVELLDDCLNRTTSEIKLDF